MIVSHPTVPILLESHGRTVEGRRAAREQIVAEIVERARREARLCGLSLNCERAVRWGLEPGRHACRNDGSTCLCECHDPGGSTP